MSGRWVAAFAAMILTGAAPPIRLTLTPVVAGMQTGRALPMHVGGRIERTADGDRRQWPGTYWEAAFDGAGVSLRIGQGDVILKVVVDGASVATLVKPRSGAYAIDGLTPGRHIVRVDIASESQAGATVFGGLYATGTTRPLAAPTRSHRIEFIGDSHTVGYGNTATTQECTEAQVWATTDTAQGLPAILARRFDADYQVNAISGRGIVRNYNGFAADTLPTAYPFVLFDKARRYAPAGWRPQLIVIALGTNDFSTPLHAGEPWATRDALHAGYRVGYGAFVRKLRVKNPRAHILLWATDMAGGEIADQTERVAVALRAAGDRRVAFVPVPGLAFSGCHSHPSLADDQRIADRLATYVDTHPELWAGR